MGKIKSNHGKHGKRKRRISRRGAERTEKGMENQEIAKKIKKELLSLREELERAFMGHG